MLSMIAGVWNSGVIRLLPLADRPYNPPPVAEYGYLGSSNKRRAE
jgi:hypothetical protein